MEESTTLDGHGTNQQEAAGSPYTPTLQYRLRHDTLTLLDTFPARGAFWLATNTKQTVEIVTPARKRQTVEIVTTARKRQTVEIAVPARKRRAVEIPRPTRTRHTGENAAKLQNPAKPYTRRSKNRSRGGEQNAATDTHVLLTGCYDERDLGRRSNQALVRREAQRWDTTCK